MYFLFRHKFTPLTHLLLWRVDSFSSRFLTSFKKTYHFLQSHFLITQKISRHHLVLHLSPLGLNFLRDEKFFSQLLKVQIYNGSEVPSFSILTTFLLRFGHFGQCFGQFFNLLLASFQPVFFGHLQAVSVDSF